MSVATKVALVAGAQQEFGLSITLAALGLARSTWYYQGKRVTYEQRHAHLRAPMLAVAEEFPEYGYRRTTSELSERLGRAVNHKVVQRLGQIWHLQHLRRTPAPAPGGIRRLLVAVGGRANLVAPLEEIEPFAVIYADFTQLRYAHGTRWLIVLLEHVTKVALGWALGVTPTSEIALVAWERAKNMLHRLGVELSNIIVHHDRDPVFTSYAWTRQVLLVDHARVSYALRGAPDNPEMESFNSRFKTENRSLFAEAQGPDELCNVVAARLEHYNCRRKHSALGNQAPLVYAKRLID